MKIGIKPQEIKIPANKYAPVKQTKRIFSNQHGIQLNKMNKEIFYIFRLIYRNNKNVEDRAIY